MTRVFDGPGWAPAAGSPALVEFVERLTALAGRGMELGLDRIRRVLKLLDDPQDSFRSIHIAGSNGKGSTAAFSAHLLAETGCRVGLYTSPHLELVTERVRIWPLEIEGANAEDFIAWVDAVEAVDPGFATLTFFEVLTAAAFVGFRERGVDVAVVEAGLGARYDATRVIDSEVAVLTAVSLEHTQILGDTLEAVTKEEAFVMRAGRPFFACAPPGVIRETVASMAAEIGVSPTYFGEAIQVLRRDGGYDFTTPNRSYEGLQLGLRGPHQTQNAALALAAVEAVAPDITEDAVRAGLGATRWPGRLERFDVHGTAVTLDGSQNAFAAETLAAALADEGQAGFHCVFACLTDKDAKAMLAALSPAVRQWIYCWAPSPRATNPAALASLVHGRVVPDPQDALREALAGAGADGGEVLVCGSLYLVGRIRQLLRTL